MRMDGSEQYVMQQCLCRVSVDYVKLLTNSWSLFVCFFSTLFLKCWWSTQPWHVCSALLSVSE